MFWVQIDVHLGVSVGTKTSIVFPYTPKLEAYFFETTPQIDFFFCGEPFRWLESDLYWFIIYHSFKPKLMISGAIYVVLPSRGSVLSEPFYCEAGAKDYTVS